MKIKQNKTNENEAQGFSKQISNMFGGLQIVTIKRSEGKL